MTICGLKPSCSNSVLRPLCAISCSVSALIPVVSRSFTMTGLYSQRVKNSDWKCPILKLFDRELTFPTEIREISKDVGEKSLPELKRYSALYRL